MRILVLDAGKHGNEFGEAELAPAVQIEPRQFVEFLSKASRLYAALGFASADAAIDRLLAENDQMIRQAAQFGAQSALGRGSLP